MDKCRACPVPTRMAFCLAGHASRPVTVAAGGRAVPTGTCPTRVEWLRTIIGQMAPAMTFQTPGGLFLAFLGVDVFLVYNEAVREYFVSNNQLGDDKYGVTASLARCPPVRWLDPPCAHYHPGR